MTHREWENATKILKTALAQIDDETAKKSIRTGLMEIVYDSFELDVGAAILSVAIDYLHLVYLSEKVKNDAGKYVTLLSD